MRSTMYRLPTHSIAWLLSFGIFFISSFALQATCLGQSSWVNPADGNWSDAANWDNGVPNGPGGTATISATGSPYLVTADIDVTLNTLFLSSSDATLQFNDRSFSISTSFQNNAGLVDVRGLTSIVGGLVRNNDRFQVMGSNGFGSATATVTEMLNNSSLIMSSQGSSWNSSLFGTITNAGTFHVEAGAGGNRIYTGDMTNIGDVIIDQRLNVMGATNIWSQNTGSITANELMIIEEGRMNILGGSISGDVAVNDGTIEVTTGSTATGTVYARGNTNLTGTINTGMEVRIQGANLGGGAQGISQTGLVNQGILTLASRDTSWNSNFDATAGFTNASTGTIRSLSTTGGLRNIFGAIVNQGTIDGTDFRYNQTSGSLELQSGQILGDALVFDTDVSVTGNTTGVLRMQGNTNTLGGIVNGGLTMRLLGANSGGNGITNVGVGGLTNQGVISLESIDSTWRSTLIGDWINDVTGITQTLVGTDGATFFEGLVTNRGVLDFQTDTTINTGGLTMESGSLTAGTITVIDSATFRAIGGSLSGQVVAINSAIEFDAGSTLSGALEARQNSTLSGTVNSAATVSIVGANSGNNATLTTLTGAINNGLIELSSQDTTWSSTLNADNGLVNNGTIRSSEGAAGNRTITGVIENTGNVEINRATLMNGGEFHMDSGSISGSALFTLSGTTFEGDSGSITSQTAVRDGQINLVVGNTVDGELEARGGTGFDGTIQSGMKVSVMGANAGNNALMTTAAGSVNNGDLELTSTDTTWAATLDANAGLQNNGMIRVSQGAGGNRNLQWVLDNTSAGEVIIGANTNLGLAGAAHVNLGLVSLEDARVDLTGLSFDNQGTFAGIGTLDLNGAEFTNSGIVSPGLSPGTLTIEGGNFVQTVGGTLAIEIGGTGAGEFDVLEIFGNADIAGTLDVTALPGATFVIGDRFRILTANAVTGTFDGEPSPTLWTVEYGATFVDLVAMSNAVPEPTSTSLLLLAGALAVCRRRRR